MAISLPAAADRCRSLPTEVPDRTDRIDRGARGPRPYSTVGLRRKVRR